MKNTILKAASLTLLATAAHATPVQWSSGVGGNDHWYDFIILDSAVTATDAEGLAESATLGGQSGYLATIDSMSEQAFLNSIWTGAGSVTGQFGGFSFFLIGLSDRDSEGNFTWIGGPEEGNAPAYTNWANNEPNDLNGEDYTVAWWQDATNGEWNDTLGNADYFAYVVEFNATMTPIPLPAGLPLLLAGLGSLAFLRRRKG